MDKNTQEPWRAALAQSLGKYRKAANLTQIELGEKLSYSDKSISKWERGEGVPDVSVLIRLSELYGVSVDELLGRKNQDSEGQAQRHKNPIVHHVAAILTMCAIVLIGALLAYVLINVIYPQPTNGWMSFVVALPVMFGAIGTAFIVWKSYAWAFGALSVALWTLCVSLQLLFSKLNPALIYASGGILQLAAILVFGFILLHRSK